jgi:hypothetical protein
MKSNEIGRTGRMHAAEGEMLTKLAKNPERRQLEMSKRK